MSKSIVKLRTPRKDMKANVYHAFNRYHFHKAFVSSPTSSRPLVVSSCCGKGQTITNLKVLQHVVYTLQLLEVERLSWVRWRIGKVESEEYLALA